MKIKRFGTISVTDDHLAIEGFSFLINPEITDVDDKDMVDKHALMAVIGYLIELMVERELTSDRTTH